MAKTDHSPERRTISREGLNQILSEHKDWADSKGHEGKRADLSNADLQVVDLSRAELQGAILLGVDLWGANLQGANLREANLWRANLQEADLREANLWRGNFQEADLREANFWRANLKGADLRRANLAYAWNLSQDQIDTTTGDEETRLPVHLQMPDRWKKKGPGD